MNSRPAPTTRLEMTRSEGAVAEPYKVLVWGPGGLGRVCMREALRLPEFALVGALAYTPDKDGVDVGVLAGGDETGVKATTDPDEAISLESDCVLHLARDFGRFEAVDEFLALLRAGRNVITVHPLHHLTAGGPTGVPDGVAEQIQEACLDGGATFHATGIHPEFICDRIAATLTGVCTDIKSISVYENWDMSQYDKATLSVIGFGTPPDELEARPAVARMTDNYCRQNLFGLAGCLGVDLGRTEVTHDYAAAPTDLSFDTMEIPAGTVGRLTHTWHGYRPEDDEAPFATIEVNWMMGRDEMVPPGFDPSDYYAVRIEGTPSVSLAMTLAGSLARGEQLVVPGDRGSEPGYYGTIATVLQAVPRVVRAEPGILDTAKPGVHWMPDLRGL